MTHHTHDPNQSTRRESTMNTFTRSFAVLLWVLFIWLGCTGSAHGAETATCLEAVDGDSLRIETEDGPITIRLWGIDAPELGQEWGKEAKDNLDAKARGHIVEVDARFASKDELVAVVTLDGLDLARHQLESGFAWLTESEETSEEYAITVMMARSRQVGIWVDPIDDLTHPEEWRRANSERPTPRPTPTPLPSLSDIANSVELADEGGDGKVTIGGIPTRQVYQREIYALQSAMSSLRYKASSIAYYEKELVDECSGTDPESADGSYWSEESQSWESEKPSTESPSCRRYRSKIRSLAKEIKEGKQKAINQALRFGIRESEINSIVRKYGMESY